MKLFLVIFLVTIVGSGCKKDVTVGIMINIKNSSKYTLDSVKLVYDTTNFNYGTISPDETIEYHFFKSMPTDPAAIVYLNNKRLYAGPLIPPNTYSMPNLKNGKYTLQIIPDSDFVSGFNARFLKN